MNKVVVPHYPVQKLPADLQVGLAKACVVTVTLDPDPSAATSAPDEAQALEQVCALGDTRPRKTTNEIVRDIRALRDEWD